ncbi:hypothetical protein ABZP26_04840 [Pseudoalteromonas sp. SD03]|uniref:Flagellar FliJ protein n=1 Tax=Pseudoalteromonas sp. SD03 TaxID=3231719 RepID=A0AB39ASN0_9GAMM
MLNKFLGLQQQKLDKMLAEQTQLQQRSNLEQQRLSQLQQHINSMDKNQQMSSALSLQNLSGMKRILSGLSAQQQARIHDSQQYELRQQQACFKQMSFTKGIEGIVSNRHRAFQSQAQQQEAKVLDEMISQAHSRTLHK